MPETNYKRLFWITFVGLILVVGFISYALTVARAKLITQIQVQNQFESHLQSTKDGSVLTEPVAKISASFAGQYLSSKYTPVFVAYQEAFPNGDSPKYAAVFMNPRGWGNDQSLNPYCGTYLQDKDCYIFLEPLPVYGLPKAKLLTKINNIGAIDWKSVVFKGNEIRFDTSDGDAGYSVHRTYSINIETGELKKLSEQENSSN